MQRPRIEASQTVSRRRVLQAVAAVGIGSGVFQRALAAQVEDGKQVTEEMVQQAEWVAGLELTDEQRRSTARALTSLQKRLHRMRQVDVTHGTPPALTFFPAPPPSGDAAGKSTARPIEQAAAERPESDDDLAMLPVAELSALIRTRRISSVDLTRLYLARLKKQDPRLHCVVSLTEELALRQAQRADREIAGGHYRGPLHGIPWGAKDLIAYPGYKTTWGAEPYQEQVLDEKATVARRLDAAGAVLVAKLSLGALAWGDRWFGGMTRNPWNPEQGSSGSSAGSASATVAGLVGFALGSETLGSIVSPCRRCGATGLRPTFGRVSRHGCMTLAWSMDKIGPICRSVEDCALVFSAIHGSDGLDPSVVERPFHWPPQRDVRSLRIGFFDNGQGLNEREDLRVLRDLGVKLQPIELPDTLPTDTLTIILNTEAATAHDQLVRDGVEDGLFRWPGAWRQAEFVPAVEYLRANRLRTMLIAQMQELFESVDAYVGGDDLVITNLTGHPTVVIPGPLVQRNDNRQPSSLKFTGRLFGETDLLALTHAYQQATGYHLEHPVM